MRNKAFRRHQYQKRKVKAATLMKRLWGYKDEWLTPHNVGARADTFSCCSCHMCRNPRHSRFYKDGRTWQEKRSDMDFKEGLDAA